MGDRFFFSQSGTWVWKIERAITPQPIWVHLRHALLGPLLKIRGELFSQESGSPSSTWAMKQIILGISSEEMLPSNLFGCRSRAVDIMKNLGWRFPESLKCQVGCTWVSQEVASPESHWLPENLSLVDKTCLVSLHPKATGFFPRWFLL